MSKLFSVIIPAYNTEKYIAQAIESVLQQTITDLEIIVINDGSNDATEEIVRSFNDSRINLFVNHTNIGLIGTLNRGLREAQGEWIALLDADDWYAPQRLEKLLEVANRTGADMVADNIYHIRDGDKFPWSTLIEDSGEKISQITEIDPVYFVSTDLPGTGGLTLGLTKPITKREFLLKYKIEYNESSLYCEDFWRYLTCLAYGARFFFLPQPYYYYRNRVGSITRRSKIELWYNYCQASIYFLEQDFILSNYQLTQAISKRLELIKQAKSYFQVIDSIRTRNLGLIAITMFHNPYFFVHSLKSLPKRLRRIYTYYSKFFLYLLNINK
jgi:succinoglycan biosynthesis protein ExoO